MCATIMKSFLMPCVFLFVVPMKGMDQLQKEQVEIPQDALHKQRRLINAKSPLTERKVVTETNEKLLYLLLHDPQEALAKVKRIYDAYNSACDAAEARQARIRSLDPFIQHCPFFFLNEECDHNACPFKRNVNPRLRSYYEKTVAAELVALSKRGKLIRWVNLQPGELFSDLVIAARFFNKVPTANLSIHWISAPDVSPSMANQFYNYLKAVFPDMRLKIWVHPCFDDYAMWICKRQNNANFLFFYPDLVTLIHPNDSYDRSYPTVCNQGLFKHHLNFTNILCVEINTDAHTEGPVVVIERVVGFNLGNKIKTLERIPLKQEQPKKQTSLIEDAKATE